MEESLRTYLFRDSSSSSPPSTLLKLFSYLRYLPLFTFLTMPFNFKKLAFLTTIVTTLSAFTARAAPTSLEKRAQCAATLESAEVRPAEPSDTSALTHPRARGPGRRDAPRGHLLERQRLGYLLDRRRAYFLHSAVTASADVITSLVWLHRTRSRTCTT